MSLGEKYVFAIVLCLVLPMCILTSCSSVLVRSGTYSVRHPIGMRFLDATRMLSTKHLLVLMGSTISIRISGSIK